ncbi:Uncharacterised protein [uncultured archaeon]|nr:Uncharacterised protein [uncultured archaeon]
MKIAEEVSKLIQSLKSAGFNPADAVFEGAISVKEDTTLAFVDKMNEAQMVSGSIKVIYTIGDDEQIRVIEIPVGQQQDQEEGK